MAKFKFYVGNAFADPKRTDLSGNPAAVVILENDVSIDQLAYYGNIFLN